MKYSFYVSSVAFCEEFKSLDNAIEVYKNKINNVEDGLKKYFALGIKDNIGEIDLLINVNGINKISNDYLETHFSKDKLITNNLIEILKNRFEIS